MHGMYTGLVNDTQGDVYNPARSTSWVSSRKPGCLSPSAAGPRSEIDTLSELTAPSVCGLVLMILHQPETPQIGPMRSRIPSGGGATVVRPSGVTAAFKDIADRAHRQHEVLHRISLVALEARSHRGHGFSTVLMLARRRTLSRRGWLFCHPVFAVPIHAAGSDVRWPFRPFAEFLVGVRGFEPPAPASRTQCSTRLSYTPAGGAYSAGTLPRQGT